jgi:hypothetical protein
MLDDCVKRMKTRTARTARERLQVQIRTAQRHGDEDELHRLVNEFDRLIKSTVT